MVQNKRSAKYFIGLKRSYVKNLHGHKGHKAYIEIYLELLTRSLERHCLEVHTIINS